MLLSLTILAAALPAVVLGGEFPVINGVVGGTPPDATFSERDSDPTDVGIVGLRYVENSGVCGETPLPKLFPSYVLTQKQRPPPACTRLQVMRTLLPQSTCGSGSLRPATTPTMRR